MQRDRHPMPLFLWLVLFGAIGLFVPAHAGDAPTPPDTLLKEVTHQMVEALNAHQAEIKADPKLTNKLVEDILLPHIDFIAASKWVLARHWRRATKQQKLEFIRQFRSLLLNFYSSALATYISENSVSEKMFTFKPLRAEAGAKRVNVHSEVHAPDGKVVPIKYSMHLTKKGWKVYDVSVEGVSMITTYRTSFASEIKQKGLDGVIASLADKNVQLQKGEKVSVQ